MVINGVLFARLSHPRCTSSHLWPWLDVDTWASSTEGSHMAKLRSKLVDGSAVRYSIFEPWPWILWCVSSFGFFSKKAQEWDGWRFTKSNLWLTEPWFWPIAILHHPFNANLLLGLNKTLPYVYIYIKPFNATRTSKEGLRFPESVVKTSHGSGELLISSLNSTFMSQAESKINQSLFGLEMEKLRHAQDD